MKRHTALSATGAGLIALGALVGAGLALYNYLVPMTGVTGTPGALLVVISSILLLVAGGLIWMLSHGAGFWTFEILGVLGVLGTLAAAWFLHEWYLMAAMVVVLAGLVLALFRRPARAV